MPGLIESNAKTPQALGSCSVTGRRRWSTSPRRDSSMMPAVYSGVEGVHVGNSFRVGEISCDLSKSDCSSEDVDHSQSESSSRVQGFPGGIDEHFERRDLISGYSTDSDDMTSSISSLDQQSHSSTDYLDDFSLGSFLTPKEMPEKNQGKYLEKAEACDTDSLEKLTCGKYGMKCKTTLRLDGNENDNETADESSGSLVIQTQIVKCSSVSKRDLIARERKDQVIISFVPDGTGETRQVSSADNKDENANECQAKDVQMGKVVVSRSTDSDAVSAGSYLSRAECDTSFISRLDCDTSPLSIPECDTITVSRIECDTSPLSRIECDTSPLSRIECHSDRQSRPECDTSPLSIPANDTNAECDTSPILHSECDTRPLFILNCDTHPLSSPEADTSHLSTPACQISADTDEPSTDESTASLSCIDPHEVDQFDSANQIQLENSKRQRSLEPEPLGATKLTINRSGSSSLMQRSKSYPQVAQRTIFVPIRPSPEQSGLFPLSQRPSGSPAGSYSLTTAGVVGESTYRGTHNISCSQASVDKNTTTTTCNQASSNTDTTTFSQTSTEKVTGKHSKQQAHPPVARVNPQTNPTPTHNQQPDDLDLKTPKGHHQRAPSHQIYAGNAGNFLHDNSFSYLQGNIPFMSMPGCAGGYCIMQGYLPEMYPTYKPEFAFHPQYSKIQQAPPESTHFDEHNNSSYGRQIQESIGILQNRLCHDQSANNASTFHPHMPSFATTHDIHQPHRSSSFKPTGSDFSQTTPYLHRTDNSQSYPKKKYKKPLLPDPSIPKYSELASSSQKASTHSLESHQCGQAYPEQHRYFVQSLSNTPSVFHVHAAGSPALLQQLPFPTFPGTSATIVSLPPQPFVRSQDQCANSNDHSSSGCSNYPSLEFVVDHTGLTLYGPQQPSRQTPTPIQQQSPATSQSLASSSSAEGNTTQTFVVSSDRQIHNQLPSDGMVYLQDSPDTYTLLDAAALHAQFDSPAYRLNQEVPEPYLVPNPAQPGGGDDAEIQNAACSNLLNSPATVRMVSSNGPPVPMPMQVPPGHMVQQIVDEHGILTHVILSSQPAGVAAIPHGPYDQHHSTLGTPKHAQFSSVTCVQDQDHITLGTPMHAQFSTSISPSGGPGSGSHYYTTYGDPHYAPGPPQYPHHPHPVPPHMHGGIPHTSPTAPVSCTNHTAVQPQGDYGVSPPLNSTDDRTLRTRNRVRKKLQRRINLNDGFYHNTSRPMGGRRTRIMGMNEDLGLHVEPGLIHGHCMTQENGPLDVEEENSLIIQVLSSILMPKVTDVESRSSLIQLSAPDFDSIEVDLDPCELKYELLLSDKGRDAKYKTVFRGDASEITLTDLRPATEYHLKVCAFLTEELKGSLTEPVSFQTLPCEPEPPQPPRLMSKTKTSLSLKWNATCENGSKVTAYSLGCDQGQGDGRFCEVYSGLQRQFRLTRLNASTRYTFRLVAINSLGKSSFSEEVSFFTSGSVPSQPDPPMLSEQFVYALTISWIRRPNDDEFLLQMEDEATGHGFITVYNGSNLSYTLRSLQRNTEYRFRLCTKNEEGQSKWSEMVCYRTQPERPQPPSKPQIKGKISPYSFHITWDPPQDSGGMGINKYIVELDDGQGYDTVYEGSEREHIFDHLTPGHVYHVRVACCSSGGRSDFSDCCVATTLPVAPSQCQVPKLQGKPKATSLHLRWGYPDYDGGAQVVTFAAQMISPDNMAREVYKGHDRDCIVTGLLPGRPYLFQVRAFNRSGAGPWSEPLEVVSGAGVPDAPKAPHVLCRSAHSALVTWDEPLTNGAKISEYRLEWQQRSDSSDFSQLYVGPNQTFDAKGLTPATMYTFRVQAISSAGPGSFSSCTACVTPPSSPSPIVSIRVKANATSLLLSWHEPSCNGSDITSYNIAVNDKLPITVDPATEYLLENLLPETSYKVRVQAVNSIGVGPYSPVVKCTTKALPPSPPRVECVLLAPASIKLKWGEGRNSDLLTYTLEMEKEDGSFQPVYTGPAHMHKVTRLAELTSYEFRIFASNEAGNGPYSDTYTFTTTKTPPPPLKAPKVRNVTPHGCLLEWQSVKPMGGDSMMYAVQLLCLNGRDVEYKQIYKGPSTHYQLESLQPNVEYQVRVAAVRLSSDGSGDITGAFSPGTNFSPLTPEPQRSGFSPSSRSEDRTDEKKPWSDQQYAAVILFLFVLLAVISAFLCQQLISYMSGPEEPSSSSLPSSTSTSSSHSTDGGGFS